jgi:hypothetical protein
MGHLFCTVPFASAFLFKPGCSGYSIRTGRLLLALHFFSHVSLSTASDEVVIVASGNMPRLAFNQLVDSIPTIKSAAPFQLRRTSITSNEGAMDANVCGTTAELLPMLELAGRIKVNGMAAGRFLSRIDLELGEKSVVLGSGIADRLFSGQNPVGKTVDIERQQFLVVGLLSMQSAPEVQESVYIPFDLNAPFTEIWLRCEFHENRTRVTIEDVLKAEFPDQDFSITPVSRLIASTKTSDARKEVIRNIFAKGVNLGISLAVAGLCVVVAAGIIPLAASYRRYRWLFWLGAAGAVISSGVQCFG